MLMLFSSQLPSLLCLNKGLLDKRGLHAQLRRRSLVMYPTTPTQHSTQPRQRRWLSLRPAPSISGRHINQMVGTLLIVTSLQSRFVLSNPTRRRRPRMSQRGSFSQTYANSAVVLAEHMTCVTLLTLKKRWNKIAARRWYAWILHQLLPSQPHVFAEPSFLSTYEHDGVPNREKQHSSLTAASDHILELCTPYSLLQLTCSPEYPLSLGTQGWLSISAVLTRYSSWFDVSSMRHFCEARKCCCWLNVVPSTGRAQRPMFDFHASPSIKQDMKSVIDQCFIDKRASEIVGTLSSLNIDVAMRIWDCG